MSLLVSHRCCSTLHHFSSASTRVSMASRSCGLECECAHCQCDRADAKKINILSHSVETVRRFTLHEPFALGVNKSSTVTVRTSRNVYSDFMDVRCSTCCYTNLHSVHCRHTMWVRQYMKEKELAPNPAIVTMSD